MKRDNKQKIVCFQSNDNNVILRNFMEGNSKKIINFQNGKYSVEIHFKEHLYKDNLVIIFRWSKRYMKEKREMK